MCIRDDHDLKLVVLAAAVCLLTSLTAVLLIRQADQEDAKAAHRFILAGGFATGFGIWATHFIAMLGYDPGVISGFQIRLTAASLVMVLISMISAFLIASKWRRPPGLAAAAFIAGIGVAAMHYVGMMSLEMPALIQWSAPYILLSLMLGTVPLFPAFSLAFRRRTRASGLGAALIMSASVVGLHFSGMAAIKLIPWSVGTDDALFSPHIMSVMVSGVTLGLLTLAMIAWLVSRRTKAAIEASERRFSILAKGISDCALYMLDRDGRIANWNAGAQRLKGYAEREVLGTHFARFYTPAALSDHRPQKALGIALERGKFSGEGWRVRKDGSRFWAHVTIERIDTETGAHVGFAKITRDMTRFKEDQDRIEQTRHQLDTALEHMHQGLCLFDAEERIVLRNRRFVELWNLPEDACPPGTPLMEVARVTLAARLGGDVPEERLLNIRKQLQLALSDPDAPPAISEFGDEFVVAIASRSLPGGGWVSTFEDITERRRSEAKIAHMALHDGLTGLPNRTSFNRWLDVEIEHAGGRAQQVAVVAIDLDRFKEINDAQGHAAGDEVLQKIAASLAEMAGDGEAVARLGGDEFAAAKLLEHPGDLADFVARVNACFAAPAAAQDGFALGASLGIAVYPGDATTREVLLNNADLAMYRAKSTLGEHICYYEPGMDEKARERRQLANDLRQAIPRNEFRVLYQPQHSLKTKEVSGYEALLRWDHPRRGTVSPLDFIPIAEENGEIMRLGEWVLRSACAEAASWPHPWKVAVNLSPVQLHQHDLPEMVTRILVETGLSPRRLELEITETAIIADKTKALHSLRRIKALGVSVAMDDFGTGYSSLDTLHSFPFDKIKIDKSFLLQSQSSGQARAIIRAVLALGRSLDIPVLAEGVETEEHLALLIGEGCAEGQGFLFGAPELPPPAAAGTAIKPDNKRSNGS
ncbi:diguanylate cyclase [Erythrobacter sp. SG61-1L]|nr:diguanylate cyclase [Erythrobacter sp. SG61-1L]